VPQVVHDSLADVVRQRQHLLTLPLATDEELTRPPVDVTELQPGHLPSAEPQADEQRQDRVVPTSGAAMPIATAQQPPDLVRFEPAR
jgi:hypothetical protein